MRHFLLAALTAAIALAGVSPAVADDFRFEGNGWGHGIGMTQYGALEQARDGRSATQIIEYYYRGATVGPIPSSVSTLLVGLVQNTYSVDLVPRGGNATMAFAGKDTTLAKDRAYKLVVHSSDWSCNLKRHESGSSWTTLVSGPKATGCNANVTWGSGTRIDVSSKWYDVGRGSLVIRPHPDAGNYRFHVSAKLGMEAYLYGLAEVPYSWPTAALRAQAVAGRSYAAHRVLSYGGSTAMPYSAKKKCWCHVYDSIQDQVYAGWNREGATSWSNWKKAVDDTAGRGVISGGDVVQAFYSSSSGGRTENVEDVWYSSAPRSFYSSVDDPWSLRSSNPKAYWVTAIGESTIRSKVGLDDLHSVVVTKRNESGSARTVAFNGVKGGTSTTVTKDGQWVRSNLGLNSAWIRRVFLPPFIDDDGNRFEADIAWVAAEGITKGCNPPTNDRYCPTDDVSRKQMAAFLVRAMGLTKTSSAGEFSDVPAGSTFAADINKLATAGITKGCNPPTNDRFCPDRSVSRAQMAAFLVRAKSLTKTSSAGEFSDVPAGSTFAADINKLATAGITKGCGGDRYCPDGAVTRDQMAAFLKRAFSK